MSTIELKSDLHKLIDGINDAHVLNAIKTILSKQKSDVDFWDELPSNIQDSVKIGMEQAKKGELKSHTKVMKKYEKWL